MKEKILLVEDEKPISDIIKFNLENEGYRVETAFDGKEGLEKAMSINFSLIILDVMLPKIEGFQVCRKIREKSTVPIVMLTAKDEELDKVLGLELGADDYITKPFSVRELIARIKANIRRVIIDSNSGKQEEELKLLDLKINLNRYEVRKKDALVHLTLREFELLKFLAIAPNQVFTRQQLLTDVWGYEYVGDIRTVDVTVRRLREKLEDDCSDPQYVVTKRGVGYYFKKG